MVELYEIKDKQCATNENERERAVLTHWRSLNFHFISIFVDSSNGGKGKNGRKLRKKKERKFDKENDAMLCEVQEKIEAAKMENINGLSIQFIC